MNIKYWARKEIELACKKENPNWDGKEFDYGCACYQSALKAYESLCEDGHSGFSWNLTKNILIRLMDDLPLKPITDEDFVITKDTILESPEYLKEMGLKSDIQCPRMSSLFRRETLDGEVSYIDINRAYGIDIDSNHTYGGGGIYDYVDKLFPITMPYYPSKEKYKVYTQEFLLDKENGDYDHKAYLYIVTPEGKEVRLDKFFKEVDGKFIEITKEEYYKNKEIANAL